MIFIVYYRKDKIMNPNYLNGLVYSQNDVIKI